MDNVNICSTKGEEGFFKGVRKSCLLMAGQRLGTVNPLPCSSDTFLVLLTFHMKRQSSEHRTELPERKENKPTGVEILVTVKHGSRDSPWRREAA